MRIIKIKETGTFEFACEIMEEIMLFITIFTVRDSNGHGSNFGNVVWKEKTIKVDLKYFLRAIENCLEFSTVQKKLRIENLVRLIFRVVGLVDAIVRIESEK